MRKKRRGRPALTHKRTKQVGPFLVTADDALWLKNHANDLGINTSELFRRWIERERDQEIANQETGRPATALPHVA